MSVSKRVLRRANSSGLDSSAVSLRDVFASSDSILAEVTSITPFVQASEETPPYARISLTGFSRGASTGEQAVFQLDTLEAAADIPLLFLAVGLTTFSDSESVPFIMPVGNLDALQPFVSYLVSYGKLVTDTTPVEELAGVPMPDGVELADVITDGSVIVSRKSLKKGKVYSYKGAKLSLGVKGGIVVSKGADSIFKPVLSSARKARKGKAVSSVTIPSFLLKDLMGYIRQNGELLENGGVIVADPTSMPAEPLMRMFSIPSGYALTVRECELSADGSYIVFDMDIENPRKDGDKLLGTINIEGSLLYLNFYGYGLDVENTESANILQEALAAFAGIAEAVGIKPNQAWSKIMNNPKKGRQYAVKTGLSKVSSSRRLSGVRELREILGWLPADAQFEAVLASVDKKISEKERISLESLSKKASIKDMLQYPAKVSDILSSRVTSEYFLMDGSSADNLKYLWVPANTDGVVIDMYTLRGNLGSTTKVTYLFKPVGFSFSDFVDNDFQDSRQRRVVSADANLAPLTQAVMAFAQEKGGKVSDMDAVPDTVYSAMGLSKEAYRIAIKAKELSDGLDGVDIFVYPQDIDTEPVKFSIEDGQVYYDAHVPSEFGNGEGTDKGLKAAEVLAVEASVVVLVLKALLGKAASRNGSGKRVSPLQAARQRVFNSKRMAVSSYRKLANITEMKQILTVLPDGSKFRVRPVVIGVADDVYGANLENMIMDLLSPYTGKEYDTRELLQAVRDVKSGISDVSKIDEITYMVSGDSSLDEESGRFTAEGGGLIAIGFKAVNLSAVRRFDGWISFALAFEPLGFSLSEYVSSSKRVSPLQAARQRVFRKARSDVSSVTDLVTLIFYKSFGGFDSSSSFPGFINEYGIGNEIEENTKDFNRVKEFLFCVSKLQDLPRFHIGVGLPENSRAGWYSEISFSFYYEGESNLGSVLISAKFFEEHKEALYSLLEKYFPNIYSLQQLGALPFVAEHGFYDGMDLYKKSVKSARNSYSVACNSARSSKPASRFALSEVGSDAWFIKLVEAVPFLGTKEYLAEVYDGDDYMAALGQLIVDTEWNFLRRLGTGFGDRTENGFKGSTADVGSFLKDIGAEYDASEGLYSIPWDTFASMEDFDGEVLFSVKDSKGRDYQASANSSANRKGVGRRAVSSEAEGRITVKVYYFDTYAKVTPLTRLLPSVDFSLLSKKDDHAVYQCILRDFSALESFSKELARLRKEYGSDVFLTDFGLSGADRDLFLFDFYRDPSTQYFEGFVKIPLSLIDADPERFASILVAYNDPYLSLEDSQRYVEGLLRENPVVSQRKHTTALSAKCKEGFEAFSEEEDIYGIDAESKECGKKVAEFVVKKNLPKEAVSFIIKEVKKAQDKFLGL